MPDDAPWIDPATVPDDLRDLQADIDAYHREQRLARRRLRWRRLTGSRGWRAFAVPGGLAVFLVILVSGMVALLMVGQTAPPSGPAPVAVATASPQVLPDVVVTADNNAVSARRLRPALFALVPLRCDCTTALASLASQADEVGVRLMVVAPSATDAEVAALPGQLHRGHVVPVFDPTGALAAAYHATGVTALVVWPDATVRYLQPNIDEHSRLELPLQQMASATSVTGTSTRTH